MHVVKAATNRRQAMHEDERRGVYRAHSRSRHMNTPSTRPTLTLVSSNPRPTLKAPPKRTSSGTMAKAAKRVEGSCACCGQERRMYMRPNGHLWCADCIMGDFLNATQEGRV